jgi:hypothetical protein
MHYTGVYAIFYKCMKNIKLEGVFLQIFSDF